MEVLDIVQSSMEVLDMSVMGTIRVTFPFWDQNLRMKSKRLSLISSSCYSVSLLYFTRTRNYSEYI